MPKPLQEGFSAIVRLRLFVDGNVFELSHVGPNLLRLRRPIEGLSGKPGRLEITIGSSRKTQDIMLARPSDDDPQAVAYW